MLEKTNEHNVDLYHLFRDFKQAYDSMDGEKLLTVFQAFWIQKVNKPDWNDEEQYEVIS
jgi:hypothetical protein